jgi:hypothetical protein
VLSRARVLPVLTIERAENAVELARALAAEGSQWGRPVRSYPLSRTVLSSQWLTGWAALRSQSPVALPDGRIGYSLRLDR